MIGLRIRGALIIAWIVACVGLAGLGSGDAAREPADAAPWDVPATGPSDGATIPELLAPVGKTGVKVVRGNVRVAHLTTLEMSTHLNALARMGSPSVRAVHDMMAMLPHSLRYDVADKRVVCPYKQIVALLVAWTTVAGTNQYEAGGTRLVTMPTRRFELRLLSPLAAPDRFRRIWLASMPAVLEDISFLQSWYEKRKDGLRLGRISEIHEEFIGRPGGLPPEVRRTVSSRPVVYHPALDRCDPQKWYRHRARSRSSPEE